MLPLDGIRLKDLEAGFMSRQHKFALFYPDGKYVAVFGHSISLPLSILLRLSELSSSKSSSFSEINNCVFCRR